MIVLQHPDQSTLDHELAQAVREILVAELAASSPGHCLRVGALPLPVMRALCAELHAAAVEADVVLLVGPREQATACAGRKEHPFRCQSKWKQNHVSQSVSKVENGRVVLLDQQVISSIQAVAG